MTKRLTRRDFSTIALGAAGSALVAWGGGAAAEQAEAPEAAAPERNYDRCMGAFLGAAIADAIGGPPECQHAARIKKLYGEITGFVEYKKPPGLFPLKPGYALHATPGSVTDDTFIRMDITRFYLATEPPRTPAMLAEWLLANADFTMWWPPAVKALKRIESGDVTAEDGGLTHRQGGGGAWWTPSGILYAGNPPGAAAEVRNLCRPWKAPLERDIIGAIHAGTAESIREGATPDSVIDTIIGRAGPLARKLFTRAAEIARAAKDGDDLVEQLYRHCLVKEVTTKVDGPMPEPAEYLEYSDTPYSSGKFAEQQPLALAAFVYTKGHPRDSILRAVMNGRDADSIASNVGGWVGGLYGESGLPKEWVETVVKVNMVEMDLRKLGEDLLKVRV